ncbi:hypothetical protein ACFXTH_015146 [Malus domestica]
MTMVYSRLSIHAVLSLIAAGTKVTLSRRKSCFLSSSPSPSSTSTLLPPISSLWSLLTNLPEAGLVCPSSMASEWTSQPLSSLVSKGGGQFLRGSSKRSRFPD